MNPWGGVRAAVAVLAGAGLVWGGTQATGVAQSTRSSDVRAVSADTTSGRMTQTELACTGADVGGTVEVASAPASWLPKTADGGAVEVKGAGSGALQLRHGSAATAKLPSEVTGRVTATGGLATGLVAGQLHVDDRDTSRGLTMSNCAAPTRNGWFFGGGSQKGRIARVTLVNPAATPTTVDVGVVGADGPDKTAGVGGTVLAPGERKVLTLGDFGSALDTAAVHVTASGAGVVASLADVWMNGETPVGESTSTDPVSPAKKLAIPAVSASKAAPSVRVAVPGGDPAIVRVRAVNTSGAVVADTVKTVDAGAADAIELSDLGTGHYSVQVSADVPVVAAVLSRTGDHGTTDTAWATPAPSIDDPAGVALASDVPGRSASLMLTARHKTKAQVFVVDGAGGHTSTVTVDADRPSVVDLGDARAVWVRPVGGGELHAAVTVTGHDASGAFLATVPVEPVALRQATSRLVPVRG